MKQLKCLFYISVVYYTIWFAQNKRDSVTYYYALITSRIYVFNKAVQTEIHACLIRHFIRRPAHIVSHSHCQKVLPLLPIYSKCNR